jgi:hypothetical protein
MGKRELIARELDRLPERDLDKLLAFMRAINEMNWVWLLWNDGPGDGV